MNSNDKADAAWDDYVSQQQEEKIEELQRELNAANESFRKLNIHALDLAARIKRLEEAGDEIIWVFCKASVSIRNDRESEALKLWIKARGVKL